MKVLALGGSGDMGRMAVAILLESPNISSITVADKNIERAKYFVELVSSAKLSPFEIDVTEHDKLVDLISSHDIVMNTVGPYYKFATRIMKATIEAKKNYVDINDDAKPSLDVLEMTQKAKEAGITALIGIGASPGLTNLMAVIACSKLDEIDDLITAWGTSRYAKVGRKPDYYVPQRTFYEKYKSMALIANAATMHLFYETINEISTFKAGKMVEIKPLTEADPVQFPGFNDAYASHIGHPEPVTLPRVIKANSVCNLMFWSKPMTDLVREYSHRISNNELSISEASIEFFRASRNRSKDPATRQQNENLPPGLCVIVTGIKDGKRKKIAIGSECDPYGGMAGVTGVPLAIAVLMILNNEIKDKGVFTPEEAFSDPMEFFNQYAKYCGENLKGEDVLLIREVDL